jgi:hypothetical protein
MNRRLLIVIFPLMFGLRALHAETEISAPEAGNERQVTTSDEEWESKGVIPHGGLTISTQPITPITLLPDRNSYDQGLEELAMAQDLFKKENMEAASDIALQAYDDFMSIHMARRNKKKRQKLRLDRHQAATVYAESSIAYIQEFVKKKGNSPKAIEEGRARLGDLRDVTQNYPELTKKLSKALEAYSVQLPPAPPPIAVSTTTVSTTTVSAPKVSTTTVKN